MRPYYLLFFVSLIFITSCDEGVFAPPEEKMVGVWGFEKVKARKTGTLQVRDVSPDFEYIEYHFFNNGNFMEVNTRFRDTLTGVWDYFTEETCTDDGDGGVTCNTTEFIDLAFDLDERILQQLWQDVDINRSRIRARVEVDGEWRRYVMVRK